MPKTKTQEAIFGILMSFTMAFGMELYNTAIKQETFFGAGGVPALTNAILLTALKEGVLMAIIVFIVSNLWGNRLGARFADRHASPVSDNPYFYRIMRQAGTVAIMCPSMSLVATILFNYVLGAEPVSQFFAIWLGTFMKNLPMAFLWNMFIAAPLTHFLFNLMFEKKNARAEAEDEAKLRDGAPAYGAEGASE